MSCLLKMLLAQRETWERRGAETDVWQGLSISLMRDIGAQLRTARFLSFHDQGGDDTCVTHDPYPSF